MTAKIDVAKLASKSTKNKLDKIALFYFGLIQKHK